MHILLINQYYYPDIAATAQLCTDWAEDLAQLGHQVTVLCGTGRYRRPHLGQQAQTLTPLPLKDQHRGVNIVRVPVPDASLAGAAGLAGSRLGRLWLRGQGYGRFLTGALRELTRLPRPDVVVALSTPPMVGLLGLLAKQLRQTAFVYWVQDIYPDLLVAMGLVSARSPLLAGLSVLSRQLYQRADCVIALDEAMAQRLSDGGVSSKQLRVIDHFCDCQQLTPQPSRQSRLRAQLGLTDEFVVCYAGNLGRGHDFDTVIAALQLQAQQGQSAPPIYWLFVGDGEQRSRLQAAVPAALQSKVLFAPPQAREHLREVLTAGDVGLVTMRAEFAGLMAPSKLYGLLAVGCPVVYVGPKSGRIPQLLATEPVGVALENGDAAGLLAALSHLQAHPQQRAAQSVRARQLAETYYDRPRITARHAALLAEVVAARAQRPT